MSDKDWLAKKKLSASSIHRLLLPSAARRIAKARIVISKMDNQGETIREPFCSACSVIGGTVRASGRIIRRQERIPQPAPIRGPENDRLGFITYFKGEYKLHTQDTAEPTKEIDSRARKTFPSHSPALATASLAFLKVAQETAGEKLPPPAFVAGHSLGEHTALAVA